MFIINLFTIKKNKGFTLIELLVVIAIIGVLASIVLVSLNSARDKGKNAAIQKNLQNSIPAAELYSHYNTTVLTYTNVCTTDLSQAKSISNFVLAAAKAYGGSSATVDSTISTAGAWNTSVCHANATGWAAAVPLKESASGSGAWWCVDNSGASKKITTALAANAIKCP